MDALGKIKLAHTTIWAFFVACILAIPALTVVARFGLAVLLAGIVALEVGVLVYNRMSCPLTAVAERYTDDRRANFDIYLPEWLARNNKLIFGTLYGASLLFLAWRWLASA